MSKSQANFGLGKTGNQLSNLRLIIENIKSELESNEATQNPQLRLIQKTYLQKLLDKAQADYTMTLAIIH